MYTFEQVPLDNMDSIGVDPLFYYDIIQTAVSQQML